MTTVVVVAMDVGQTGIKVRIISESGISSDQLFAGVRTDLPLLPQLAAVARSAAGSARIGTLAAGVSGLTSAESDPAALRALLQDVEPARVLLAHDSVTSFLGAIGLEYGAVVAAGTGVVTLGVGHGGVARVDGWGNLIGDAGSGYWIGREALDAVMRAHDGRGPATSLTAALEERWRNLEEAYIQLQGDPLRVSAIASLSRTVASHAETDPVARRISERAGQELALSAATALRRTSNDEASPLVSMIGGVFEASLVRAAFVEHLNTTFSGVRVRAPKGDGLDGTVALAGLATNHPLRQLVSE